jgi:malonyl-CoA O-methyltransferase
MTDEERPPQVLEPRAAYARWAASYPAHAHNPLMRAEERAMLSLFPANLSDRTVVDAGCGSGRYVLHALRYGAAHVVGADLSAEMLGRAKGELGGDHAVARGAHAGRNAPHVDLIQASITALPLRDQCADLTICGLTIGHLRALEPALAELQRITRTDGSILCSDFHPLAHARGWRREFTAGGQRYAVRHTPHYIDDWRRACAALGLRVVRVLDPPLDPNDIRGPARFDPAALEVPVVIVFELARAASGGAR